MANPVIRLAAMAINEVGKRQSRTYRIERGIFDPANAEHVRHYGFHLLGDVLKTPSRGLHQIPSAQLQEFSLFLLHQAGDTALFADNSECDCLYRQGHVYEYRSLLMTISARAVTFIAENPNNSMRLLMRAFTNDALELPAGTMIRMREHMKGGARDGTLFRELIDNSTKSRTICRYEKPTVRPQRNRSE
jgi:hypothetical protein